jgi:hypothetical protein
LLAALSPDDFADGNGRAANGLGHGVGRQAQRLHKVLSEHVARMNRVEAAFAFAHNSLIQDRELPAIGSTSAPHVLEGVLTLQFNDHPAIGPLVCLLLRSSSMS